MNIMFLKIQWEFFGLRAPAFSWVVSGGLIVYCVWVYLRQWRESRIRQQALSVADKRLKALWSRQPAKSLRSNGIPRQLYDAMDNIFSALPLLHTAWQVATSSLVSRSVGKEEERFWVAEDIGAAFSDSMTGGTHGYRNASAILTGVGLLATFLAILVALLDVRLANNRIQGLDLLIHGLSGKFLSSVVAVGCATLLVWAEKGLFHPVSLRAHALGVTLRSFLPRLTPAQILLDSQREIVEELKLLRTRDAGLAFQLNQGLAQSVEPALERMAERFHESLSGATQGQFGQVSESLGGTAQLLQQMNSQLALTGNVLNELTDLARRAAVSESTNRQTQIEDMTGVVGNLMGRLEGHTDQSMGSMEKAMAAITCDMSRKITDLSVQMAAVIEKAAERSTGSAREILDQAGALSSRSAEQLALLLERHSAEMAKVDDLRNILDGALRQFTISIERYGHMTEGMERLTTEVNKNVSSLAAVTTSVAESQEMAIRLMGSTSGQLASLNGLTEQQQGVWSRIEASMTQYETVFQHVEGHARELLTQIARHLGGYSSVTEKHFSLLTTTADNFISQATGRLSGSIDELGEQLDELHSAVNKMACASQSMR